VAAEKRRKASVTIGGGSEQLPKQEGEIQGTMSASAYISKSRRAKEGILTGWRYGRDVGGVEKKVGEG